jgi:TetR/AcrR family transcriptional repressor of nem operon
VRKQSNREKILAKGLRVVHRRGFGASVRDIVQAAGVPQGSFSNHFTSKEAFGIEILNMYFAIAQKVIADTLRNDSLPPLKRLGAYIDAHEKFLAVVGVESGCLYGNYCADAIDQSEPIRMRLIDIFDVIEDSLAYCLKAAVTAGELPAEFKCKDVADFLLSSLQGAILFSKAARDTKPIAKLKRILFSSVLR